MLDLNELERVLKENSGKKILVSVIHANNETGVIQNIKEITRIVFEHKGFLHFDCSQSLGKTPFNFDDIGADMVTLSSHKLGGPKGVAALVIKKGLEFNSFIKGGAQQKFLRAGTENLPAIKGFAEAISESVGNLKNYKEHCKKLISHFEIKLK
ncbi:MAG TPA: cysteine desulfurase NifS, partial [Alphaproteobacteria bacterium]|nr:cysteine desulfurase NifS [Alphaproteobacteria bacterium]